MAKKTLEELEIIIQLTKDYQDVQNIMGRHMYYHAAGKHREEFDAIWAKNTPGIRWTTSRGCFDGYDVVRNFYVDSVEKRQMKTLEVMSELYPGIVKNENSSAGVGNLVVHCLTSPVIEIAKDGKTAKGVWYSPGQATEIGGDGKPIAMWMWERYGVDFVKEDDEWKIWHMHTYYDLVVPVGKNWIEPDSKWMNPVKDNSKSTFFNSDRPVPNKPVTDTYTEWNVTKVPQMLPKPPLPYDTFNEVDAY